MQAFWLPIWVIKQLERLARSFLWKGQQDCLGGHCLVNWPTVCLPKINEGLGIPNLQLRNISLLIRWLWKLYVKDSILWTDAVRDFYGDFLTLRPACFFLQDLKELGQIITVSTTTNTDGVLVWRWELGQQYSSKSTYNLLCNPGVQDHVAKVLWKMKIPKRIRIFIWLLVGDRLPTGRNLTLKHWPHHEGCVLCGEATLETTHCIFIDCVYTMQIWHATMSHPKQIYSPINLWLMMRRRHSLEMDRWFATTTWNVWKERNRRIFQGKIMPPPPPPPRLACNSV